MSKTIPSGPSQWLQDWNKLMEWRKNFDNPDEDESQYSGMLDKIKYVIENMDEKVSTDRLRPQVISGKFYGAKLTPVGKPSPPSDNHDHEVSARIRLGVLPDSNVLNVRELFQKKLLKVYKTLKIWDYGWNRREMTWVDIQSGWEVIFETHALTEQLKIDYEDRIESERNEFSPLKPWGQVDRFP